MYTFALSQIIFIYTSEEGCSLSTNFKNHANLIYFANPELIGFVGDILLCFVFRSPCGGHRFLGFRAHIGAEERCLMRTGLRRLDTASTSKIVIFF